MCVCVCIYDAVNNFCVSCLSLTSVKMNILLLDPDVYLSVRSELCVVVQVKIGCLIDSSALFECCREQATVHCSKCVCVCVCVRKCS